MFWCEGLDSQLSRRLHQSIQLSSPRRKAKMCLQVRERYSCHCLYYQLGVDRCPQYGRRGHTIQRRTKYVGNACARHSEGRYNQRYSNLEHDISRDAEGDVDSSSANSRHPQKGDSAVPAARRPLDWRDMSQRLLELEPLRHLWPQVVRKCKSTADEQARIEEFVLRFCFDLFFLVSSWTGREKTGCRLASSRFCPSRSARSGGRYGKRKAIHVRLKALSCGLTDGTCWTTQWDARAPTNTGSKNPPLQTRRWTRSCLNQQQCERCKPEW